jgi:hypothetical protein
MSGDYEAMKRHRSKYGFGLAAMYVYPGDPAAGRGVAVAADPDSDDPNAKVVAGLPEAQRKAYFTAMDSCMVEMVNKATGKKLKSMREVAEAQGKLMKQAIDRELNGDARLVEPADAFGDCLKGQGLPGHHPASL